MFSLGSLFARLASLWTSANHVAPSDDARGDDTTEFFIDAAGWIHGPGVIHMPSARGRGVLPVDGPTCVVRHGTATAWGTGGAIARSWRTSVESHSAHVTIDVIVEPARTAEVARWRALGWHAEAMQLAEIPVGAAVLYQHRSLLAVAWHAAGSIESGGKRVTTSGSVDGRGFNEVSIGIEMTCVGQVARKLDGRWRGWKSGAGVGYGSAVPADQVQTIGGRSWHTYHPATLATEGKLDALLLARWPALAGAVTVTPSSYTARTLQSQPMTLPAMAVGHCDVDPTRKADPYPTGVMRGRPPASLASG